MNATEMRWEDLYRQGEVYVWWERHDEARLWAPLEHPDRQVRYLVAEVLRMQHHPHPAWLTEMVGRGIDACGLDLPAVQQFVSARAPADAELSPELVREAYRRETLRRHWGWVWKTVSTIPAT
jgi:hypothetical protein